MRTIEVLENGNAESLKDVIDIEHGTYNLSKITEYITPTNTTCPENATVQLCNYVPPGSMVVL